MFIEILAGDVGFVTCRLTAKNRDQLRNPTLGSRLLTDLTPFYLRLVFGFR